ncbi:hypothetical protein ACJMK2_040078 [Sinanodonta woodiana]|uniref:C2 domain-containing protein n=1 Tax=Sinanodonta woodiana TaxID=1069815 RepID=A0ABD3WFG3_SINWO
MVLPTVEEDFNLKIQGPIARGQLKLAVYMNTGLLTVHVIKAKHVGSKMSTPMNTFALIYLIPDEKETCRCRTKVIPSSNNPVYDEKFSFELTDDDLHKRILISIWHQDPVKRLNEFLGCTSFGIARLRKILTAVKGWYYLLNETMGRKKHLQITKREMFMASFNRRASLPAVIPAINKDITGVKNLKMTVHKDREGFGFTLVESCPVKVGRVKRDSHAAEAGLMEDDVVMNKWSKRLTIYVNQRSLAFKVCLLNSGSKARLEVIRQTSDVFIETMTKNRRLKRYHCDEEESRHVPRTNADLTNLRDSEYVSPPFIKFFARFKSLSRLSFNLS